jgi:hypothetical protein
MCGIFAILNDMNLDKNIDVHAEFSKGEKRGPEFSILENNENNFFLSEFSSIPKK